MQSSASATPVSNVLTCEGFCNEIRWQPGGRLEHLFESQRDALEADGCHDQLAVVTPDVQLTYRELDDLANQLAHFLITRDVRPGDRVGLLFDKSHFTHIALLGCLKAGAAYVPLDPSFPAERIEFILEDACVTTLLTLSEFAASIDSEIVNVVSVDGVNLQCFDRDPVAVEGLEDNPLCYIIYTSGTTGKPKGVAVSHASICNFVALASEVYGYQRSDRVYQGMTIAFDFSVEELWVPLASGATLIPGPSGAKLVADELSCYLRKHRITAMCCVPTLLATVVGSFPDLRLLIVSGEACPPELIKSWWREGRRILNVYGPTEATVSATWSEPRPGEPITIGVPLPTYSVVVLSEEGELIPEGEPGEICIAGVGLAEGYVNRDDVTARAFISDFLGMPNNPSSRLYRTGDLGRITPEGRIEYLGRIDTQVKIRGYRIELSEIESVLLESECVHQVVVNTHESPGGGTDLAAYCVLHESIAELPVDEILTRCKEALPPYMVPTYLETVPSIPMTSSHKVDRKALPVPQHRVVSRSHQIEAPNTPLECTLAEALAEVLELEQVSVTDDFFEDLGAHSLLLARVCANVKREHAAASLSIREFYEYPSIRELADHVESDPAAGDGVPTLAEPYRRASNQAYWTCGFFQALTYLALLASGSVIAVLSMAWIIEAESWSAAVLRTIVIGSAISVAWTALPIVAKWVLIGRWKPKRIPIWSAEYFRFWLVKTLIGVNPMTLLKGLPAYNTFLRLLGARVGRHVIYQGRYQPVCTDLLSIGAETVIRKGAILTGYRAEGGYIYVGDISIGARAYVGEMSMVDIHTSMGDDSQLGHASCLLSGQSVPDGASYHGSPAERASEGFRIEERLACSTLRRVFYTASVIGLPFVIAAVVLATVLFGVATYFPWEPGFGLSVGSVFYLSAFLSVSLTLLALLANILVPALLNRFLSVDRQYVNYGFHFFLVQLVRGFGNSEFFNRVFGDSAAIVHYLKIIGYDLSERIVQSGSNFGITQLNDNPHLCRVGSGTMVADGLTQCNVRMNESSFILGHSRIGDKNYLGNDVFYPCNGQTGNNCLLATKVMVPVSGAVREDTGLLGSPAFEIPRAAKRDMEMSALNNVQLREQQLWKKGVHNFVSASLFLTSRWLFVLVSLGILYGLSNLVQLKVALVLGVSSIVILYVPYLALLERIALAVSRLRPQTVSIYHRDFWCVERYWKFSDTFLINAYVGTPIKNWMSRLSGARIGRRVYDDGLYITEKILAEVGDDCTFNVRTHLQSHSLEEGVFKSDHIMVGDGCSLGPNALVHYGTEVEDGAAIAADAFFMKGSVAPARSVWQGNPARQL